MEKIDLLLEKLEGKIPASLGNKIDKLDTLKDSYDDAFLEHEENPTEETLATLKESKSYIDELESSVIEQLTTLFDKKQNDAKAKEVEAQNKPIEQVKEISKEEKKEETKESSGILGLVIGAVLLVGSLGAINYFKNNR
jgi:hypothetical protein